MVIIKQHFVPKFYLKNFSKNNHILYVYDRELQKSITSNVFDIATKKYFYDLKALDDIGQKQTLEILLSSLETEHSKALKSFLKNLWKGNSGLEVIGLKTLLSEFIILLFTRTPSAFERSHKLVKEIDKGILEKQWFSKEWIGFSAQFKALEQFAFEFNNVEEKSYIFHKKIWIVWENNTDKPFITSDNPVVGYFEPSENGYEMYFPISPKFSLSLYDKEKYSNYSDLDGRIVQIDEEHVLYCNDLIYKSAKKQCFSIDNNFDYLIKE
jgi:hypothetical protein